jgi:hypothetical protein
MVVLSVTLILTSSVRGFKLVSKNSAELRAMIDDLLNMTLESLEGD